MTDEDTQTTLEAIQELSRMVGDLLIQEHELQDRELVRMSSLLHEAVSELAGCFSAMSDQLVVQSSELRAQGKTNTGTEGERDMNSLMLTTQQMNSCVTRAVVALQFEDILQQMINHNRQRVEEAVKLLRYLQSRIEMLEQDHINNSPVILEMLKSCHAEIASTCEALDLNNPAQQQTMKKGDVTLF